MPRVCTVCHHPERDEIDAAIIAGTVNREIACKFGVGRMAIERHAASHISQQIRQSQEAQEEARGLDVVGQLKDINDITLDILKEARDMKDNDTSLKAIDRVTKQLELQAKILGDIGGTQVNIYVTPEWQSIRSILLQSLLPFPEAKIAVASALSQLEVSRARLN